MRRIGVSASGCSGCGGVMSDGLVFCVFDFYCGGYGVAVIEFCGVVRELAGEGQMAEVTTADSLDGR